MTKHSWTKETMDRCWEAHLDQIEHYYGLVNKQERMEKLYELIEHYLKIRWDVQNRIKENNGS